MGKNLKIMVVDDALLFRAALSDIFSGFDGVEVVGTASNGQKALERILRWKPDFITLDLEMPVMDGLETLWHLSREFPEIGVVIVSSANSESADKTMKALGLGCLEFIVKPSAINREAARKELSEQLMRVISIFRLRAHKAFINTLRAAPVIRPGLSTQSLKSLRIKKPSITNAVLIGSSTGGPRALGRLISNLPKTFHLPVLIVQHMPKMFTQSLAKMLNEKSSLHVQEGKHLENIYPGHVYIAPGGQHMTVCCNGKGSHYLKMNNDPPENSCRPSVDVLFRSACKAYPPKNILCVILTGMGSDGVKGVRVLQSSGGGYCLTQSKETCTVYGMPRSMIESGLVCEVQDLDKIGDRIIEITYGKKRLSKKT